MAIDLDLLYKAISFVEDPKDEAVEAAALIMLQMTRKQILYRNIMVRPKYMKNTLIYELKKCIALRKEQLTDVQKKQLAEMLGKTPVPEEKKEEAEGDDADDADKDAKLIKSVGSIVEKEIPGQRKDHNELPDDVKGWLEGSKERWFHMKELHNTLQQMDAAPAEERAPYTQELRRLYAEYRKCLNDYDAWKPAEVPAEPAPVNIAQKVATARKYLSDNREKLAAAIQANDEKKVETLRAKMQERIRTILDAELGFDEKIKEELISLGLNFD